MFNSCIYRMEFKQISEFTLDLIINKITIVIDLIIIDKTN